MVRFLTRKNRKAMIKLLDYPRPFWEFSNHSYSSYTREEIDGEVIIKVKLPGKSKDDIEIKYSADSMTYTLFIDKNEHGHNIHVDRQINSDAIKAKLELGILTITAPILNQDKTIQIE